jgi:hypothetical protein
VVSHVLLNERLLHLNTHVHVCINTQPLDLLVFFFNIICFCFLVILGLELKASCLLEPSRQSWICFFNIEGKGSNQRALLSHSQGPGIRAGLSPVPSCGGL